MTVTAIDHVNLSVPSARLPEMLRFYTGIVGLVEGERPHFNFPGHWLYADGARLAVLHLASYSEDELALAQPTGRFNHVCFRMTGLAALKGRLDAAGLQYREQRREGNPVIQLFVRDPAGVMVELSFDRKAEGDV
jgi:catechol 2,3-dioxygenase-like lactoylglutathione lyase family enzyme